MKKWKKANKRRQKDMDARWAIKGGYDGTAG